MMMMMLLIIITIFDAYFYVDFSPHHYHHNSSLLVFIIVIISSTPGEMISIGLVLSRYNDDIGAVEWRLVIECDCWYGYFDDDEDDGDHNWYLHCRYCRLLCG